MKKQTGLHGDGDGFADRCTPFFREIQIEYLIHDMKDPVAIIETGARALLEKAERYGPLSNRQEKTLKRILRNVRKAQGMLNDLLEIGRSQAGCFVRSTFVPARVVIETLAEALETVSVHFPAHIDPMRREDVLDFFSGHGIHLKIETELMDMEMLQDEIKFRQIVGNLVKNALYHRKVQIDLTMNREQDDLIIEVADDGPGIDPEHHQMIFKHYFQVNDGKAPVRKGHGIGLAGALICARSIGGDIQVDSMKGQGACFRMTLPIGQMETY